MSKKGKVGRKPKRKINVSQRLRYLDNKFNEGRGFFFGREDWRERYNKASLTNRTHNKDHRKGWKSI
jgi:hypothetical protein